MKLRVFALAAVVFAALGAVSSHGAVAVGVSVGFAPPPLVVYTPPPVPVAGYIWTPGYWAWNGFTYYWVPGAWVAPPSVGLYWTPPWWGFDNGVYLFHDGYWGPTVGWYGGINYGYGYFGNGYWGGRWNGNTFAYNTAVVRVNKTVVTNTFVDRSVLKNQTTTSRASFNGPKGVTAQPTAEQKAAAENANKQGPTSEQLSRREAAGKDPKLQAKANGGHVNADAIRSFNKTHGQGQADAGTAKGAGGETATGPKTENATGAGAEHATAATSTKKATSGAETKTKTAHERGTERHQNAVRSTNTKPHENFNAVNRRSTYATPNRSHLGPRQVTTTRRPQVSPGKPTGGAGSGQPAGQQQGKEEQGKKKKPDKGQGQ
ncbi:MAG TPA: YXWGXW repeat-containing protein [Chthoniobacterales bacterium]